MNEKTILTIITVLLVGALAAFIYVGVSNPQQDNNSTDSNENVAARVNGEEITKAEFQERMSQAEQNLAAQGQNLEDQTFRQQVEQQIIDQMIAETLLLQEVEKQNITVNSADVEEEYRGVVESVGGEESFKQELAKANLTEQELKEGIRQQHLIQEYFSQRISEGDKAVTEEEVNQYYEQLSAQQENVPALEEIRPQLTNQISQQKENQIRAGIVQDLRSQADIEILI